MTDRKDASPKVEAQTFFEKIETATPLQVSHSVIAQILLKIRSKLQDN